MKGHNEGMIYSREQKGRMGREERVKKVGVEGSSLGENIISCHTVRHFSYNQFCMRGQDRIFIRRGGAAGLSEGTYSRIMKKEERGGRGKGAGLRDTGAMTCSCGWGSCGRKSEERNDPGVSKKIGQWEAGMGIVRIHKKQKMAKEKKTKRGGEERGSGGSKRRKRQAGDRVEK